MIEQIRPTVLVIDPFTNLYYSVEREKLYDIIPKLKADIDKAEAILSIYYEQES